MKVSSPSLESLTMIKSLADAVAANRFTNTTWEYAASVFRDMIGHRMFTILRYDEAAGEVIRLYSDKPDLYPVSGTKPMGATPWGEQVLRQGKPFLGKNAAAMCWAFPDHELLASIGMGSVLNLPVRLAGVTLGTINLTHQEGFYHRNHIIIGSILAALLTPIFVELDRQC